jgi:hypothetical protein
MKSAQYQLVHGILFKKIMTEFYSDVLKRKMLTRFSKTCMMDQLEVIFSGDTTTHKILRVGYYWPTLFKDAHAYSRSCDIFQKSTGRERKEVVPLQPVVVEDPFEQWGLDIIGEINPHSSKQHRYILTATDYFTLLD